MKGINKSISDSVHGSGDKSEGIKLKFENFGQQQAGKRTGINQTVDACLFAHCHQVEIGGSIEIREIIVDESYAVFVRRCSGYNSSLSFR